MTKVLTSFTKFVTGEGTRLSGTYSIIDDNGAVTEQNNRFNLVVAGTEENQSVIDAIAVIDNFMSGKMPE